MHAAIRSHPKAAFEISKGARRVLTLSEADVERHLDLGELLDGLEEGFRGLERGEVQAPSRPEITVPGKGFSLAMPAWRPGSPIAVKIVNVFDANLAFDVPNHLAMILLFAQDTGATLCVMDGTYITGVRTAASAVLSARMLARQDARVATIVGAGVQAREHLRLLPLVRGFDHINVCSLHMQEAERLAARHPLARAVRDVEAAVRESDVVCLATHSAEPVIQPHWIKPGTHVSSVGYHPPRGELPVALARGQRLFVETLDAFAPTPVGCAELAGLPRDKGTTLGAVALGRAPGRTSDAEITVYKAMGIAMEDMVAATLAYERALAQGGGGSMDW
ncbi:ornithine cyclodeaminase family protein [Ramlibacter sp.]|uniref:ornithine cyclodeaminase family protein n=1 Tax=Ramlibacter sp. TaxID=1917967 RepID=UPI0018313671|nr:ornithine cyclodeaminase family protein [Ramlibacter sp.]MBA2675913.1 ornithine cyclodeaminase family protein [Ramlibacter sp.]